MAFRAIRYTNEHEIYLRITTNLPSLNNLSNLRKPRKYKDLRRYYFTSKYVLSTNPKIKKAAFLQGLVELSFNFMLKLYSDEV